MPRGPSELATVSATTFAAIMLFLWASLPVDLPVPSLRISTGIFPPACAILFTYEMVRQDRLRVAVISFVKVGAVKS
jgi:hypothetical protein